MLDQSRGKIFLSGERGLTETDWFRSYNTFNFGNYRNEHKAPFGALYVMNDETLAGGKHLKLLVENDSNIFLLPTVGAITYKDSTGNETMVEAGQAQIFTTLKNTTIEIGNPYENDLVNFLQIWMKTSVTTYTEPKLSCFNLQSHRNGLIEIYPLARDTQNHLPGHKIFIGKFTGREEAVHKMARPGNGLFAFVLEGAFEVQFRLLETRDGLALWNAEQVELEALSNDAIILLVEIPYNLC